MKNEQDKSRTNEGNERRKSNQHGKSSTNRMAFVTLEKMHDITDSLKCLLHVKLFC